jgi:hypothetical protein
MAQNQDLGFEPLLRLEAVAQHAGKREAYCDHLAIMSDSPPAASQMDGVFRSDNPMESTWPLWSARDGATKDCRIVRPRWPAMGGWAALAIAGRPEEGRRSR